MKHSVKNHNSVNAERYEAQGFVEAMIAILVTSIVIVIMWNISATALRQLAETEIYDQLTHEALLTSDLVQIATDQYNYDLSEMREVPLTDINNGECVSLSGDIVNQAEIVLGETPSMVYSDIMGSTYTITQDHVIKTEVAFSSGDASKDTLFRSICKKSGPTGVNSKGVMIVNIVTGTLACSEGAEARGCYLYDLEKVYRIK